MGSSMAENHPVGFQWVMEAREKRRESCSCRSALHSHFGHGGHLGAAASGQRHCFSRRLIHYVLEKEKDFREYVVNYTNASMILRDDFQDTEDLAVCSPAGIGEEGLQDRLMGLQGFAAKESDGPEHGASGGHAQDRGGEKIDEVFTSRI